MPAKKSLRKAVREKFPRLRIGSHWETSEIDPRYNCIAWAANDTSKLWWPHGWYWPPDVPQEVTLAAFIAAFQTLGFEVCADGRLKKGIEKLAIYLKDDVPTHAARQLPTGMWASKLGPQEDIEHKSPGLLFSDEYGKKIVILERKRVDPMIL